MLRTRVKNWKLRRQRRALLQSWKDTAKGLKGEEEADAWHVWRDTVGVELDVIDATIRQNDSRDLLDEAEKLHLPTPARNQMDKWLDQDEFGHAGWARNWNVLTPEATTELRAAIRKERRERREAWEFWIKLLGAIIAIVTGLIGAAIGLVSVLRK